MLLLPRYASSRAALSSSFISFLRRLRPIPKSRTILFSPHRAHGQQRPDLPHPLSLYMLYTLYTHIHTYIAYICVSISRASNLDRSAPRGPLIFKNTRQNDSAALLLGSLARSAIFSPLFPRILSSPPLSCVYTSFATTFLYTACGTELSLEFN